jgi:hypothetical protein
MLRITLLVSGFYLLTGHLFAQSDGLPRGAYLMPYHRYEAEDAQLSGNAVLYHSTEYRQEEIASEASNQQYVGLPDNNAALSWTLQHAGNGITIRFTMPDGMNGEGENGSIDLYVDNQYVKTIDITSYWAWQYFPTSDPDNAPAIRPRMKFDEIHFLLSNDLQPGQTIKLIKTNGDSFEYGIDFLEIEEVADPITKPTGYISVTDYGAVPNDGIDDHAAFVSAIGAASSNSTGLYIPAGTFNLSARFHLWPSNITVTGVGMWYTEIFFTTEAIGGGGIFATGSIVDIGNLYVNTVNDQRFINGQYVNYKGFSGHYGANSSIHDVWVTHFETGAWIADYSAPIGHTENLTFTRNRIRNNYADGINLSQGTSNSTVSHCDFRSNGDDAMAVWPSSGSGAQMGVNNTFHNNTVEFTYRAGGAAIFGGNGHKIHHCIIKDGLGTSGLRLTTDFAGYHFQNTTEIKFYEITIENCGTSYDLFGNHRASIDLKSPTNPVSNITFDNIDIINSQRHAVQLSGNEINVTLSNINIDGTGLDPYDDSNFTVGKEGTALFSSANAGIARLMNFNYQNVELDTAFFVVNSNYNVLFVEEEGLVAADDRSFLIDFGPNDGTNGNHTPSPDQFDQYWNNVDNVTPSSVFTLNGDDGTTTSIQLTVNAGSVSNGIQNGGLLSPDSLLLDLLAINTATQDYFYTTTTTSYRLSNLDQSKLYAFELFGSRNTTGNRATQYQVTGLQQESVILQTSGTDIGGSGYHGNNSALAQVSPMKPDQNGEILIEVSVDQGAFAYINLMAVRETLAPEIMFIDFGPNDVTNGKNTMNPDVNDHYWNNWNNVNLNASLSLVDHFNEPTPVTLRNLTSFSQNGILTGGLLNPDENLLDDLAVNTATQDYFFVTSSGSLEFSGLDLNKAYQFTLFGTRDVSQTRTTQFTLSGSNIVSGSLQTSGTDLGGTGVHGNNSSTFTSGNVFPTAHGKINLRMEVAEGGFAYLNLLKVVTIYQPVLIWSEESWNNARGASASLDATINGNYETLSNGSLTVRNLTINEGQELTVNSGTYLEVKGDLLNNGNIIVESGGSLITYDENGWEGNDVIIKRNTRFADGRYSFVGSPVKQNNETKGADLGTWSYTYDETIDYNVDGLERWRTAYSEELVVGKGYAQAGKKELVFEGVPNMGGINLGGYYTDRTDQNDGWNLLANPYSAAINLEKFLTANDNITGAVYLWDDHSSPEARGNNSDYIVANAMGVTNNSRSGNESFFEGYIGAMQGFFVKLQGRGDSGIEFTENMREFGNNSDDHFFRKVKEHFSIKLSLSNALSGEYDELIVGLKEDATIGEDRIYDAPVINTQASFKIFSYLDDRKYSIQGLPEEIGVSTDIGFNVGESGKLTMRVEAISGEFHLLDKLTGQSYALNKLQSIEFTTSSGVDQNRFRLTYGESQILFYRESPINFSYQYGNGMLSISSKNSNIISYRLYDLSGKTYSSGLVDNKQKFTIQAKEGVKIIQINTQEGLITRKVLLRE